MLIIYTLEDSDPRINLIDWHAKIFPIDVSISQDGYFMTKLTKNTEQEFLIRILKQKQTLWPTPGLATS